MSVRDMQTRGSIKDAATDLKHSRTRLNATNCAFASRGDGVFKIVLAFFALFIFYPAFGQAPADASPEEGNLLGVILFFIIFVGTIVGGAAYYWWRAKDKPHTTDDEKMD